MATGREIMLQDLPSLLEAAHRFPVGQIFTLKDLYDERYEALKDKHGVHQAFGGAVRGGEIPEIWKVLYPGQGVSDYIFPSLFVRRAPK